MIEVGLTGGIGCGKSTVSRMFAGLGALIIDADELARDTLSPGGAAYSETVRVFGKRILTSDGSVDRAALAELVFADAAKRRMLESIVHPAVFALEKKMVEIFRQRRPGAVVVFDAALLIESGAHARMDKVVVVWCSPETQMRRLTGPKGLGPAEARRRVSAQMPLAEKLSHADFVIDNEGDISETKRQVDGLYRELLQYV